MATVTNLSPRQHLFVQYYLTSYNASKSVIKAGYNTKWPDRLAWKLLHKPHIKKLVQKGISVVENRVEKNRALVEKRLCTSFERNVEMLNDIALQAKDNKDRISAIKEMNAMLGYLAPTKSIHANVALDLDKVKELTSNLLGNHQNLIDNQTVTEALPTIAINGNDEQLDMLIVNDKSEVE
jgi:phage terminase small subunit